MSRRPVYFVGWPGALPLLPGTRVQLVQARDVARHASPSAAGAVVVLGPMGLVLVSPIVLRAVARAPYAIVLLLEGASSAEVEDRWRGAGVGEFVPAPLLAAGLERAIGEPVRLDLPMEAWFRGAERLSPRVRRALSLVPTLLPHTVVAWAEALGCNRRTVLALCRRVLGMTAEAVLWAWRAAVVQHERLRRISSVVIASMAKYGSRSALYRAYSRRGLPFPPAGRVDNGDSPTGDPGR